MKRKWIGLLILVIGASTVYASTTTNTVIGDTPYEYVDTEVVTVTTPPAIEITPVKPEPRIVDVNVEYTSEMRVDVFNIEGFGQINMDDITVTNNSDLPVKMVVKSVRVRTHSGTPIVLREVLDTTSTSKSMKLWVENTEFVVEPYTTKSYQIKGEVNHNSPYWGADDSFSVEFLLEFAPVETKVIDTTYE